MTVTISQQSYRDLLDELERAERKMKQTEREILRAVKDGTYTVKMTANLTVDRAYRNGLARAVAIIEHS